MITVLNPAWPKIIWTVWIRGLATLQNFKLLKVFTNVSPNQRAFSQLYFTRGKSRLIPLTKSLLNTKGRKSRQAHFKDKLLCIIFKMNAINFAFGN